MNSTPIFIINMDSSQQRWHSMEQQLARLQLTGTRVSAVVGKNLSDAEVDNLYDDARNIAQHHRPLSTGEIGCYASHRKIWQMMIEQNIPYAVILEDDVKIEANFNSVLESLPKLTQWDLIKLSDNRANTPANSKQLTSELRVVSYNRVPNCANGYVLSLAGVKKLLGLNKVFRPVDIDMQFHSALNLTLVGIMPYAVSEVCFDSDIAGQNAGRHSNRSTFWRNLRFRIALFLERKKESADLAKIL